MDISIFSKTFQSLLKGIDLNFLYEMRFRTGYPIKINYKNEYFYITNDGLSKHSLGAYVCDDFEIDNIISNATESSIYAFNEKIKQGYITLNDGTRIGICGECVFQQNEIKTIKNFYSLNIRIPHEIIGCANNIIDLIIEKGNINNTLIASPPFLGKTTLLKDIARSLDRLNVGAILIIDERGEFSSISGENIDLIKYSDKLFAFNYAIRTMSPAIVITDELICESDWQCVKSAINSGVKIVSSCHSDSLEHLVNKEYYIKNLFDKFVFLEKGHFGQVKCVYNKELKFI